MPSLRARIRRLEAIQRCWGGEGEGGGEGAWSEEEVQAFLRLVQADQQDPLEQLQRIEQLRRVEAAEQDPLEQLARKPTTAQLKAYLATDPTDPARIAMREEFAAEVESETRSAARLAELGGPPTSREVAKGMPGYAEGEPLPIIAGLCTVQTMASAIQQGRVAEARAMLAEDRANSL